MSGDDFFIGWSAETPRADRRFLLGASIGLIAGAGALGGAIALSRPPVGDGVWDMGTVATLRGQLLKHPYPLLRTRNEDGAARTVFLASDGKVRLDLDEAPVGESVAATGTLITRGKNAMMAVTNIVREASAPPTSAIVSQPRSVLLAGEILDAKCWFGAMRPGFGKTHKACAALCARGGLPLAFCETGACGTSENAPLFLDQNGEAFGPEILALVADPVIVQGTLGHVDDVVQLRVALGDIHRV